MAQLKDSIIDGKLEVVGDVVLKTNGDKGIKGIHTGGNVVSMMDLTETNCLRIGYGNYKNGAGYTDIYGSGIRFHCSSANETFVPYYEAGDRIDFIVKTSGFVTNNRKAVAFIIPITKPVIGSPTATIESEKGFILRQNGSYTHGSNGGVNPPVYVQPTGYFIEPNYNNGFVVTATFNYDESDAVVTNNDHIGIVCEGTVILS